MPIYFDLEALRKEHSCVNYFETGLFDPRTDISSKKALSAGFEKVYSIELRKEWVDLGMEIFKEDIASGRYHLISDDSSNMKDHFDEAILKKKTMFFLDAHVDNADIHNYKRKCPLLDELDAIKSLERKDHVILIDDLRIFSQPFPWGENSYGDIKFLDEIQRKLLEINPEYKFTALRGVIEYDVLVAAVLKNLQEK
jgi:hypothetical protein